METGLYVVATPIGNLGDITERARQVLAGVDLVAAEDTRHSRRLLQHLGVDTPLCAYHDHSGARDEQRVLECLRGGGSVALVSDAGTPLISDPGYRLVRLVQDSGVPVIPVPGASAMVAALSVCGLPTDRFLFEGFLPSKEGARRSRLEALAAEPATLVFYEAPHRVAQCLQDMRELFGDSREAVLARELTKTFETVCRAPLGELCDFVSADSNQQRGEIVLLVAGHRGESGTLSQDDAKLLRRLADELPPKRAAALVAELRGLRKKDLYQYLLDLKGKTL